MASAALQKFMAWVEQNRAQQPSLGAELRAMGREMVKDVRSTLHEVAWGQAEHFGEPGTPLCPTPQLITADLTKKDVDLEMDR
jgi:hypothetical protein